MVLIWQPGFQVGGGGQERRRRRTQEGRRWKLKPCSVIKTGVNFFLTSLWPEELLTMATGEHRGGGGASAA